jgi:RNA polymerase sigma-70 factor (ECF subfamily)
MQATEAYIGSVYLFDLNDKTQEMQDALASRLTSFHRKAFRYVGNAADAEDAVQEALLSAYKHLDQFQGKSQMSTWLTAIVANCARMQLRKRPRQIPLSLEEPLGGDQEYCLAERLADKAPSPEDECRASELRGRLMEFVSQLSPPLRRAFQLRDLEGLTTHEAANILGVADGTVKAQLARARAKLKRLMGRAVDPQSRSALTCYALPGRGSKQRRPAPSITVERAAGELRANEKTDGELTAIQ